MAPPDIIDVKNGESQTYFHGLDGLRGFAAMMVVLGHVEGFKAKAHLGSLNHLPIVSAIAPQGVNIFFTLSGFLITYLLLVEKAKNSDISIGKFYLRRVFRIWPLFFLAVFLSFFVFPTVFDVSFFTVKTTPDFPFKFLLTLFLLPNVVFVAYGHIFFHGVLWSVGSEEQFYMLWPHVVRKSRNLLMTLLFLLGGCFGLQYAFAYLHRSTGMRVFYILGSLLVFVPMIVGAIGAVLHYQKAIPIATLKSRFALICLLIIVLYYSGFSFGIFDRFIYSLLYLLVILHLVDQKSVLLNFDSAWMRYLGKISYGIYIFHSFPIALAIVMTKPLQASSFVFNLLVYSISVALTIGLAHLSFTYFESGFLRLKEKYGYRRQANRQTGLPVAGLPQEH